MCSEPVLSLLYTYDHTKTRATHTFCKEKQWLFGKIYYIWYSIYIYVVINSASGELQRDGHHLQSFVLRGRHRTRYLYFVGQGETAASCKLELWAIHHRLIFARILKKVSDKRPGPFQLNCDQQHQGTLGNPWLFRCCILVSLSPFGGFGLQVRLEFVWISVAKREIFRGQLPTISMSWLVRQGAAFQRRSLNLLGVKLTPRWLVYLMW